jgi:hypothetical protein
VLVVLVVLLLVGAAGAAGGLWMAFQWMRQFTPEREGELLTELAALRASQRLGRAACDRHRQMLQTVLDHDASGESA